MFRKFPLDKINGTKNALFFFASSNLSQFLLLICNFYELKHKVRFSKPVCGILDFQFPFVLIKVYIFVE